MLSNPHVGLHYSAFMAALIRQRDARVYLEIGVDEGVNMAGIDVPVAHGVDPAFNLTADPTRGKQRTRLHRMTSDSFFRDHAAEVRADGGVDFAFLDGMHLFEFLLRDFYNTEALCRPGAVIALHDSLPFDGQMVQRFGSGPAPIGAWTGDVWKVVPILEKYRPDLSITLVDCAPTGLVCVADLDPSSTLLREQYGDIVAEFGPAPNDAAALRHFYDHHTLTSAADIILHHRQSLYFPM